MEELEKTYKVEEDGVVVRARVYSDGFGGMNANVYINHKIFLYYHLFYSYGEMVLGISKLEVRISNLIKYTPNSVYDFLERYGNKKSDAEIIAYLIAVGYELLWSINVTERDKILHEMSKSYEKLPDKIKAFMVFYEI